MESQGRSGKEIRAALLLFGPCSQEVLGKFLGIRRSAQGHRHVGACGVFLPGKGAKPAAVRSLVVIAWEMHRHMTATSFFCQMPQTGPCMVFSHSDSAAAREVLPRTNLPPAAQFFVVLRLKSFDVWHQSRSLARVFLNVRCCLLSLKGNADCGHEDRLLGSPLGSRCNSAGFSPAAALAFTTASTIGREK